jgi:hypothetical protein
MIQEALKTLVSGHVQIRSRAVGDKGLGDVVMEKYNAIHPKNMATAIARGLSNAANYQIFKMKLGNRGTYIDGTQQIVFNPPITTGDTADLYNPTYVEVIDDADVGVGVGNSVTFTNIPASTNTRVIATCVISANEGFTNASDLNNSGQIQGGNGVSPYFFDELGLFTKETSGLSTDMDPAGELMLSHLIFSPIEHTGNRELVIVYTLTISVS